MDYQKLIMVVVITLFVFLIIRELVCWYFKINERVALQKLLINEQLKTNVYLANMSKLPDDLLRR